MIDHITIQYFKSFYGRRSIPFSKPDGKKGSGLTLLVGPNKSGKSTIFEALLKAYPREVLYDSEKHPGFETSIKIYSTSRRKLELSVKDSGEIARTGEDASKSHTALFHYIPSIRPWTAQVGGAIEEESYVGNEANRKKNIDNEFAGLLSSIIQDSDRKEEFNSAVKKVILDFSDWEISRPGRGMQPFVKYRTLAGVEHRIDELGDGVSSVMRIVAHLYLPQSQIQPLLIDEPELSLHPQAQKRLAELLALLAKERQIIVATHSPIFIRWKDIENGAKVHRISKTRDQMTKVCSLSSSSEYYSRLINSPKQWQKPYLLDAVAKEIFFADGVLFVEGQEDVGLLRTYLEKAGSETLFDIFGYGVGGATNTKAFLEMANDLGVRSAAIFDGDSEGTKAADDCKKTFRGSLIINLSTSDIRDKYRFGSDCKVDKTLPLKKAGLFTTSGILKKPKEVELEEIKKTLKKFFTP